jgi:transmembrane sensor
MMDSNSRKNNASITLSDEAIDWLVRLQSGHASEADRQAWLEWRCRSDEHENAALEAETIWHSVGFAGDDYRKRDRTRRISRRVMIGGGLAVLGAGIAFRTDLLSPLLFSDHTTSVGERRDVALNDGSTVLMNSDTALSVDYSSTIRQLTLYRGQATFRVFHDPARPFVVKAANGRAQAIGTKFDVDIRRELVIVTTLEGLVQVTTSANGSRGVNVDSGHQARYSADGRLLPLQVVDLEAETAWQRGKLRFDRRPLGDVTFELQRYRREKIIIANSSLQSLEVSGVFDTSDPEAVLQTIEDSLAVQVVRLPFVTIIR